MKEHFCPAEKSIITYQGECSWCGEREALAQTQEPVPNVEFMRQVLSVAIAGLYKHYKDDVLRVFTLDDLQTVVDLSDSLRLQQVEDIYKRAWKMLAASAPPQRTWVGLTDEDCKGMSAGDKVVAMWANRTLKEKNT